MQNLAIHVGLATLLVFLFGAVAWIRPDDRMRCWFAGCLCVLGSSTAQLGQFYVAGWRIVLFSSASVDLMALAGVFFVVSAGVTLHGRRFAVRLWLVVALPTLLSLTLAETGVRSRSILVVAVLTRQIPAFAMMSTIRRIRPKFSLLMMSIFAANCGWMLYFIFRGQPKLIVPVILAEIYFVAGVDFWNKRIGDTIGMRLTSLGLMAWATTFPVAEIVSRIWPHITFIDQLWNSPKACVTLGAMLMLVEEEVTKARALAQDYRLVFDSNPHPLWIFDTETLQFRMANEAACALHGYKQEEFLQLKLPDILHSDARQQAIQEARRAKPVPNRASRHIRKDGTPFPMDIIAHSVVFQGRPCRFVLGLDVTKRDNLERRLEYQLDHDALTGLANRRSFEELLTDGLVRSMESGKKLAIICFDIFHFKRLNEVYGPRIGDQCVQYVASVLSARTRAMDFVARTGDDEFAIVLTELRDLTSAEEMAVYLKDSFKSPIPIGEYEIQLSFSLGLAAFPDDAADAMALWHLAESALRRAQAGGGGQAIWLSPELRADAEKRLDIATNMNKMLEEDRFNLVYQPLYAFDGTARGMEALLRLNHPRYGAIAPPTVVQTAEETGQIEPLGQWVFERACRQMQTWMDGGVRLVPLAINVSSLQLMRKGFAERLAETLDRYSVNPKLIHLEITETAAMDNLKEVSGEMSMLSALGCRFSIDDFGTGHSSLGRLHHLPISILKIDRSFTERLCIPSGNGTSSTIVEAILSMGHALELQVVAEGVETEEQLKRLCDLGCDLVQGFLLSRPVTPEYIPDLIAGKNQLLSVARPGKSCDSDPEASQADRVALAD